MEFSRCRLLCTESPILEVLWQGEQLIKPQLLWIIHNGKEANFWINSWDGDPLLVQQLLEWKPLMEQLHNRGQNKLKHYWQTQDRGVWIERS